MKRIALDDHWKFHLETENEAPFGTVSRKNQEADGFAARGFNATHWKSVTLPHDWAIALPYDVNAELRHGHRRSTPIGLEGQVPGEVMTPVPTVGWYRRRFHVPAEWLGRRVLVEFDGVYRDSRVWINGELIDRHASGYTGFRYDLTDNLYYGEDNVIAVAADSRELEGWWYEGAGIYRHARLIVADPLHLDPLELRVSADMNGALSIEGFVLNDGDADRSAIVSYRLTDGDGSVRAQGSLCLSAQAWGKAAFSFDGTVSSPRLWSPEQPCLYRLTLSIWENGESVDEESLNVGFRTFRFDADQGLFVNGQSVKIKGACIHQDFAGVGVALPDELHEYKIRRLKEMGINAYRSSHHAPAPEIVDACDRLGLLLMDETRLFGSTPDALRDVESLVRRDRNHACVLMWSIGNEEHSVQNTPVGARIARSVMRRIRALDPVNYITYGGNNGPSYEGINAEVDVRGINYIHIRKEDFADAYHAAHPSQPLFGSEETSIVMTRGEYRGTEAYMPAYGEHAMPWGSTAEGWWKYYMERPFLSGAFIWTGFDYNGEPAPYMRNAVTSFGVIDLCGYAKDPYYYYQAWWTSQDVLHLLPHWNWEPGESVRVMVFGNTDEVELLLNGRSLGRKAMEPLGHLEWQTVFEPGVLEAVGYRDGREILRDRRVTAGAAARICLTHEEAAPGGQIELIHVQLTDENGCPADTARRDLSFRLTGEAELLGVGNGDPASEEPDQFEPQTVRRDLLGWRRTEENGSVAWNAFAPRGYDHYLTHRGAEEMVRMENYGRFRDPFRFVPANKPQTLSAHFNVEFTADDLSFTRLDFARLEGRHVVRLNGEEIGRGNAMGWPCSFDISLRPGKNRIEVDCSDVYEPGGIYRGVWLSKQKPAVWTRSAFNGLALAVVRKNGPFTIEVSGEGLQTGRLSL